MGSLPRRTHRYRTPIALTMCLLCTWHNTLQAAISISPQERHDQSPKLLRDKKNHDVVMIAAPNQHGVSHNHYQQFDVGKNGVILANNINKTSLHQAEITANPNLKNHAPAQLIINEVSGNQRSYLQGLLAVAGTKADVVIANPNGIVMNGYNPHSSILHHVLTTGKPIMHSQGALLGYRVTQGHITVTGKGGNFANVDRIDLISRAVTLNGAIWADSHPLNIVTGSNEVVHDDLYPVRKITGADTPPKYAIDLSAMGGLHAGKIHLIGTEQGIGVKNVDGEQISLKPNGFDLSLAGHLKHTTQYEDNSSPPTFGLSENDLGANLQIDISNNPQTKNDDILLQTQDRPVLHVDHEESLHITPHTPSSETANNSNAGLGITMDNSGAIGIVPVNGSSTNFFAPFAMAGTALGIVAIGILSPFVAAANSLLTLLPAGAGIGAGMGGIGASSAPPHASTSTATTAVSTPPINHWTRVSERHVMYGDTHGGGHLYQFARKGKSVFPKNWGVQQIKDEVNRAINNPNAIWQNTPDQLKRFTHATGTDGFKFKVIVRKNGKLVTAYPIQSAQSPSTLPSDTLFPPSYYIGAPLRISPHPPTMSSSPFQWPAQMPPLRQTLYRQIGEPILMLIMVKLTTALILLTDLEI
jgi:filamentous hemagglutinin family protein